MTYSKKICYVGNWDLSTFLWLAEEGLLLKALAADSVVVAALVGRELGGAASHPGRFLGWVWWSTHCWGRNLVPWLTLGEHLGPQVRWLTVCAFFDTHWVLITCLLHKERGQRTGSCTPSLHHPVSCSLVWVEQCAHLSSKWCAGDS